MLLRLGWYAFNIWAAKKSFDLMKENHELKQKSSDDQATIRTLARQVPPDVDDLPETPSNPQA